MKIEFIFVARTTYPYLQTGVEDYLKRLQHYVPATTSIVNPSILSQPLKAMEEEASAILKLIKPRDFVVILDEKGSMLTSREFAVKIQNWMLNSPSRILFITGGAFGISEALRSKANFILSASKFTFTHQMIRLILLEQVYRAMTIIRNESYHHD